jgi:hypothetical protein
VRLGSERHAAELEGPAPAALWLGRHQFSSAAAAAAAPDDDDGDRPRAKAGIRTRRGLE